MIKVMMILIEGIVTGGLKASVSSKKDAIPINQDKYVHQFCSNFRSQASRWNQMVGVKRKDRDH